MESQKKTSFFYMIILLSLMSVIVMTVTNEKANAKSLYVIADKNSNPVPIQAYDIGFNGDLEFQIEKTVQRHMNGAIGLALDESSGILFMTYEASDKIQIFDASTMGYMMRATFPDVHETFNPAGIVFNQKKDLLYCVDRKTDQLYVYNWDPNTFKLSSVADSPFTLAGATAFGIALDETNNILYVANATYEVYAYSTSTWALKQTIMLDRLAISVAVDVEDSFLYTGAGFAGNTYLTQYDLVSGTKVDEVEVEPDAGVLGLGVDPNTGFVYVSTGIDMVPGGDNLVVYDKSLNEIDRIKNVGNPTGLVIPSSEIGYNPLNLSKYSNDGVLPYIMEAPDCIIVIYDGNVYGGAPDGECIEYSICFDTIKIGSDLTHVTIIDKLPDNVTFASADSSLGYYDRYYDESSHSYIWEFEYIPAGTSVCLELVVTIEDDIGFEEKTSNYVAIYCDQFPRTTTSLHIANTQPSLDISKNVVGAVNDEIKEVKIGNNVTYRIDFGNTSDFNATKVTIIDTLPEGLEFVSANNNSYIGSYDSVNHSYIWSFSALEPNDNDYVELTLKVADYISVGTVITNNVMISGEEMSEGYDSASIIAAENSFNISKTIVGAVFDGTNYQVPLNSQITYQICFYGEEDDMLFTDVNVVDTLPKALEFVSAEGDGIYGQYNEKTHQYVWTYDSVNSETQYLELVVQLKEGLQTDTIVTNTATITSDQTMTVSTSVNAITFEGPEVIAQMELIPEVLNRNGSQSNIVAVLQFPQSYTKANILTDSTSTPQGVSITCHSVQDNSQYPGGVIEAMDNSIVIDTADGAKMYIVFDKADLFSIESIPDYCVVKLEIVGSLVSGGHYMGQKNIYIVGSGGL